MEVRLLREERCCFFDEIQTCPAAVHSLWFFYEDYPELYVIAAGSLLEFALKKMASFGASRVHSLFVYPMSFDEFLRASGNESWLEARRNASSETLFGALHDRLVESFRTYLLTDGMPESVAVWVETEDYLQCQQVQDDIIQAYEDDFSKYEEKVDYVMTRNMKILPIEIKAGTAGSMKSMYQMMAEKHLDCGIRSSLENFEKYNKVDIIPLYALSNLYFSRD